MDKEGDGARVDQLIEDIDKYIKEESIEDIGPCLLVLAENWDKASAKERRSFSEIKPDLLSFLFHKQVLDEFLGLAEFPFFSSFDLYEILNQVVDRFDRSNFFHIIDELGWPVVDDENRFAKRLLWDPDSAADTWLNRFIQSKSTALSQNGHSFHNHSKTMRSFQMVRWSPDDLGVSEALEVLGKRPGRHVDELLREYLLTLPWGADREATLVLLSALADRRDPDNEKAVWDALRKNTRPDVLRRYLLGATARYYPLDTLKIALDDLAGPMDLENRAEYLDWLHDTLTHLEEEGEFTPDFMDLANRAEALDTRHWSPEVRGYLAKIMRDFFPDSDFAAIDGLVDRLRLKLVQSFLACRLEHMGCGVSIPILVLTAFGMSLLLDWAIGTPTGIWRYADWMIVLVWVVVLALTSRTHFSGHETLRQQFYMALLFWGATLLMPLVMIVVRYYIRYSGGT